jgi:hypothetical protein
MGTNYFMTDKFLEDARRAVQEAVQEADALGLPKASVAGPELPAEPVVVRVATRKKKIAAAVGEIVSSNDPAVKSTVAKVFP